MFIQRTRLTTGEDLLLGKILQLSQVVRLLRLVDVNPAKVYTASVVLDGRHDPLLNP
jgi:hypothetical protein